MAPSLGLDKIISQRKNDSGIGFSAKVKDIKTEKSFAEALENVGPEDLIKFGLIPEFVGRLPVTATLDELDEKSLIRILTEPKNALVNQYKKLFDMEGCELEFRQMHLSAIAKKAMKRKTGARGLRTLIESLLLDTMYDLPSQDDIIKVVIDKNVVDAESKPLLIYKSKSDNKEANKS